MVFVRGGAWVHSGPPSLPLLGAWERTQGRWRHPHDVAGASVYVACEAPDRRSGSKPPRCVSAEWRLGKTLYRGATYTPAPGGPWMGIRRGVGDAASFR